MSEYKDTFQLLICAVKVVDGIQMREIKESSTLNNNLNITVINYLISCLLAHRGGAAI